MIRFAYFDAGGTMISPHPSVGGVYAAAGRRFGLAASPDELERAFRAAWKRRGRGVGASDREWWRALVLEIFEEVGFDGDRGACFDAFFEAFSSRDAWRLWDDVVPALQSLREAGVRCGVLSNWDYRLRGLLEQLELTPLFDAMVISSEVGFAKPDPRIYALAAERAGVSPTEILYAGDDLHLDLLPARAAGFQAYLIDRTGRSAEDSKIRSLSELVAIAGAR